MGKQFLSESATIEVVLTPVAAGTSAQNTSGVDMTGYDGVLFVARIGTANANNTMNLAQSADDVTYNDLLGTSITSGASDVIMWLDVQKPGDKFVRAEFVRGTSTTIDLVTAHRYHAREQAVDNNTSGTVVGEAHVSPIEGTA